VPLISDISLRRTRFDDAGGQKENINATSPRFFEKIAVIAEFLFAGSVVPGSEEEERSRGAPPSASPAPASEIIARYRGGAASEGKFYQRLLGRRSTKIRYPAVIAKLRPTNYYVSPRGFSSTIADDDVDEDDKSRALIKHARASDESVFPSRRGGREKIRVHLAVRSGSSA